MVFSDRKLKSFPKTGTEANLQMMNDPKYADLKITNSTKNREWLVHRAVVCGRCPFFEACLRNSFKESQENIIDLPTDDPIHLEYILKYLYTVDLKAAATCLTQSPKSSEPAFGKSDVAELYSDTDAFALFSLADRLGLYHLKCHWLDALITKAKTLDVNLDKLDKKTLDERRKKMAEFLEKAYDCENAGADEVRTAAIKALEGMTRGSGYYYSGGTSQHIEVLGDLIEAKPQLGIDLIMSLASLKNNKPVIDLLNYSGLREMLLEDNEALIKLVDSLALSRG